MASTVTNSAMVERPTRVRYWVIVFAVTLAVVTYIDRVCISCGQPSMQRDLGLSDVQMGWAFAAFGWAYALFEIPGGFMGDWMGPRRVLMRIVLWWSFFTAATGWAWNARLAHRDAVPFRGRRSGLLPQPHQSVHHLAAGGRARAGAGHHVAERPLGRRFHAAAGGAR